MYLLFTLCLQSGVIFVRKLKGVFMKIIQNIDDGQIFKRLYALRRRVGKKMGEEKKKQVTEEEKV